MGFATINIHSFCVLLRISDFKLSSTAMAFQILNNMEPYSSLNLFVDMPTVSLCTHAKQAASVLCFI